METIADFIHPQEKEMRKFYSPTYGFLHACKKDGKRWFNLTDICRYLGTTLKVAEGWIKECNCTIREYTVRRAKITSCNRYVDDDGLSTVLIYCSRTRANNYRRWISNTVAFSLDNPSLSFAIQEFDSSSLEAMSSPDITEAYKAQSKARAKEVRAAIKDGKKIAKRSEATSVPFPRENDEPIEILHSSSANPADGKLTVSAFISKTPPPPKETKKAKKVEKTEGEFRPVDNHLLIEEWFRQEFPIAEFLVYLDEMVGDLTLWMKKIPKKDRWPVQHRINVMNVFRKMLKANEGNIRYQPTPERLACCSN